MSDHCEECLLGLNFCGSFVGGPTKKNHVMFSQSIEALRGFFVQVLSRTVF